MTINLRRLAYFVTAPTVAVAIRVLIGGPTSPREVFLVIAITVAFTLVLANVAQGLGRPSASRLRPGEPRFDAAAAETPWNVWINDVRVGTVSDAEYTAMRRLVRRDPFNALAQLFNVFEILLSVLRQVCISFPLFCFWIAFAALAVSTATGQAAMQLFVSDPAPTTHLVLDLATMLTIFRLGIHAASGDRLGFRNHYSLARAKLLRHHCNSPVVGDISLSRQVVIYHGADPHALQPLA